VDYYMTKTAALLRDHQAMLEGMRARAKAAPKDKRADAARKLKVLETKFEEMTHHFELLKSGAPGAPDLKVALEKAIDAFRSEMSGK
jgi:hypothetical protein